MYEERFLSVLFTALPQILQASLACGKNPTTVFKYINEWISEVYKSDLLKNRMRYLRR